jgi:Rieske Fe-S protein
MRIKESLLSRRDFFVGFICGGLSALAAYVGYPMVRFLFHKKEMPLPGAVTIALADIETMAPNSAAYFTYGHLPGILLKTADGELRAFSAKCTHLDCTVQYLPGEKKFLCACHDGYFDDQGVNIAGPPPSPLPSFSLDSEGDQMLVRYEGQPKRSA